MTSSRRQAREFFSEMAQQYGDAPNVIEARIWLQWMADRKLSWTAWKLDDCEPDSTCILRPRAPLTGDWTEDLLAGHGPLVREWMLMED